MLHLSYKVPLVLSLEEFIKKADKFLKGYYAGGNESQDVEKMLKSIRELHLEIDETSLEQEFELYCEKQDLLNDYYDSAWY
ncbi:MAG: hypothetical protein N4J56_007366 [Chroococcidiopsis sp. SAG 2025]|uniref:hypothetical protein n=1 Tax=Chroococcidiopsis sp. SAG 2025 TaxID=171389 RepID=UPI002936F194|nr:hypothetical protein [Chroococcidiopsis sp. SAG 2025]MDV2997661.1 hypothetical protein [Chroococcidiopsis sp. SAG 2025]